MATRQQLVARAAFCSALYVALVVAGWGFVSLLTNTDPIPAHDVGPLVAPVSVGVSVLVVFWSLGRRGQKSLLSGGAGATLGAALTVAVSAVVAYLVVGAALAIVASGVFVDGLIFLGGQAATWYSLVIVASALAAALGFASLRGRAGTPQWPWEKPVP